MRDQVLRTIALHRRDLGEADRLASLLTRDEGKLVVTARGSRKPNSKLAALVEPFALAECRIIWGRGELQILAGGEVVEPFRAVRDNLEAFATASLLCEVANHSLEPGGAAPRLFDLLLDCLRHANAGGSLAVLESYFLLHASRLLGYGFALSACAACGEPADGGSAFVSPEAGGVLCEGCHPREGPRRLAAEAMDYLRLSRGARLTAALDAAPGPAAIEAVRDALREHVRYHLDAELRSLSVLRSMSAGLTGSA